MANYIHNQLKFEGDQEKINEVLQFIKNEELDLGSIDFNKIVPLPEGEKNLYAWCIEWWGTKWNAYYQECNLLENTIYFVPANMGAPDVVYALSHRFPNILIDYYYYERPLGCYARRYVFKDYNIIKECTPEPFSDNMFELIHKMSGIPKEELEMNLKLI